MDHLAILVGALLVLLLAAGVVYFLVSVVRAAWRPREGSAPRGAAANTLADAAARPPR